MYARCGRGRRGPLLLVSELQSHRRVRLVGCTAVDGILPGRFGVQELQQLADVLRNVDRLPGGVASRELAGQLEGELPLPLLVRVGPGTPRPRCRRSPPAVSVMPIVANAAATASSFDSTSVGSSVGWLTKALTTGSRLVIHAGRAGGGAPRVSLSRRIASRRTIS